MHPNGVQYGSQDLARIHYAGHKLESVAKPVKTRMQWGPKFISDLVEVTVRCQQENSVFDIQGTCKLGPDAYSRPLVKHQEMLSCITLVTRPIYPLEAARADLTEGCSASLTESEPISFITFLQSDLLVF